VTPFRSAVLAPARHRHLPRPAIAFALGALDEQHLRSPVAEPQHRRHRRPPIAQHARRVLDALALKARRDLVDVEPDHAHSAS
jgi:hypothetical protein